MDERTRQTEREALSWALDEAPVVLFSVDAEGRYTFIGGGGLRRGGMRSDEVVGRRAFDGDVIPPSAKEAVRRALRGEGSELRATVRGREWSLRLTPLHDEAGRVVGATGLALDVNDQSIAETRLAESEARLRALVDALPFEVWARDAAGICVLQNPASVRRAGNLVGSDHEVPSVPEELRRVWKSRTERAFAGQIVRDEQRRMVGGELRFFETIVAPIRVEGRTRGTVGANIDLTERERAKGELQRERDFTEAILEAAAALIVVLDADGRIVRFNRASEQLTGLTRAQVLGKPFWEAVAAPESEDRVRRAFGSGRADFPEFLEVRIRGASGERLVAWTNKPLFVEGKLEHVICSGVDVTDRREEELSRARRLVEAQEARRRSEFLAESGRALSASLDYEETLATVADIAVRAFSDFCVVDLLGDDGLPRRVAVACGDPGRRDLALKIKSYAPAPDAPWGIPFVLRSGEPFLSRRIPDWVRSGTPSERARVGLREDGHQALLREMPAHSMLSVPLVARRRTLGALTFVSSDEGRVYGDSDVLLATELANRAALAVDNARLYREAREAVQAREEFLSIASHELRTPLTSLQLCAQSLPRVAREEQSEAERRYERQAIDTIERQSKRLARLVDTLLDLTRAQSGRLELVTEETDLVELSKDVLANFEQEIEATGQELSVRAPPSLVGTWDRPRLDQVMTNLVSNALKYGEKRPIVLTLGETGDRAFFEVRDEGQGIAPERQARVFERFERVGQKRISGLGLGLYIAKCIVEAHGGEIRLTSGPGQGTTVRVELPWRAPSPR